MKRLSFYLFSIGFVLFCFSVTIAQPGSLDDTFDGDGKLTLNIGNTQDFCYAVAIQEDGKIVLAGNSISASDNIDFALFRLNPDGILDNSFDMDGKVTTDFNNGSLDIATALEIQPDGKILAAGITMSDYFLFALARYNTDGSLDDSFGSGGLVTTYFTGFEQALDMAIQDDGKILLAGMTHETGNYKDFAIARYNTDGSLDNSFGTGGKILTDFSGYHDEAAGIAVQPDGKIIAVGSAGDGNTDGYDFALVRYNTDGSFDGSFGTGGKVITDFFGNFDKANSVAIQPDGKIVLGGSAVTAYGDDFALARYNTNGDLDASFGIDGKVTSSFINDYTDKGNSVALQEDGKIIFAGFAENSGAVTDFGLVRYNTDGSNDFSFGLFGVVMTDFGGSGDQCYSVAIQADNKILLAGFAGEGASDDSFGVARYISGLETGILNFSEINGQLIVYPNPIYSNATLKYSLQKEETISIGLYDLQGKLVQSFVSGQHKPKGDNEELLNFSKTLPAGYYNLVISNENGRQSIRIIKQ